MEGSGYEFCSYIEIRELNTPLCTLCGNEKYFVADTFRDGEPAMIHCGECHGTGKVIKDVYKEVDEV